MQSKRTHRRRVRNDRGETLLELIIAVTIIALAVGPLLGALVEALTSSSEGRSFATIDTVLQGFAETATSQIQLAPAGTTFNNCAGQVNYKVLSLPTPRSAAAGAAVTVFGTGFGNGIPITTFSVTVGGAPAHIVQSQSQPVSGTEMGNMQVTFTVPSTLASGPHKIVVSDGQGDTASSTPATDLTVTPHGSTSTSSPLRGYTLGVASVRYWKPGTTTELNPVTDCVLNGGLQLLTLHARAASGVSDTLTFALRNPENVHIPVPTPAVTVSASPVFTARPPVGKTAPLVFTATVTPASGEPHPTQAVHWVITEAGHVVTTCPTLPTKAAGTDTTEVYTCTVNVVSSSNTGRYKVTATYPKVTTVNETSSGHGFASVYAQNGSGTVTVAAAPTPVVHSSTGNVLTFTYTAGTGGMFGGQVTIAVPSAAGTPKKKWTTPTASTGAGHTVAKVGTTPATVVVTHTTIKITDVTLPKGGRLVVVYGQGGGSTGVTAPTTAGTYTFIVKQASVSTATTTLTQVVTPVQVTVTT